MTCKDCIHLSVCMGCANHSAQIFDINYDSSKCKDFLAKNVYVPFVHAKWITTRTIIHDGEPYCSNCGEEPYRENNYNLPRFCPSCGALMDRGEKLQMKDATKKYSKMITEFSASLELAKTDTEILAYVQELIDRKDKNILSNIDLLSELEYNIRHGKIKIMETNNEK